MSTTQVYDQMVATMPEDLPKRIMQVLTTAYKESPGSNVTKQDIIKQAFPLPIRRPATEDRQLRDTIADLQLAGYPIVASSGKAGYRLAVDSEDAAEYISELESRKEQLQNKIDALRGQIYPAFWKVEFKEPVNATQPLMI